MSPEEGILAMTNRFVVTMLILFAGLGSASAAFAQPLEMKNPSSKQERPVRALPDQDLRPAQPAVPHKPGFIPGLSKPTRTGRTGAAGWTAPTVPSGARGAADPESSGTAGFGFAAEWGGAPRGIEN